MIEIKNLNKYYNKGKKHEQHILKNINLTFADTGLVCILGESGCGKTTLLNMIGGMDAFSDGSIKVEDTTITDYNPKVIEPVMNDHYGYIFQNYYMLKDYSVEYNIMLALNRYNISEEEKKDRTDKVLHMLGLEKLRNKPASKLSGGQQQRVSIARALVKTPDIILADEPTGNLDEENTLKVMTILRNLSKTCLIILVTHERKIADFMGDRIIEIKDGEVVNDFENHSDSYERSDDNNIYLKELKESTIGNEYADLRLFYNENHVPEKLNLNLVYQDGKLYIQSPDKLDLVVENKESGFKILDEERPKIDMTEIEQYSCDLDKIKAKGTGKLPFREVWHMAATNLKIMGKKQFFISIILIAAAIALSLTSAQFVNTISVDEDDAVMTDTHYVNVTFSNVSVYFKEEQLEVLDFVRDNLDNMESGDVFYYPSGNMYLIGEGFAQLENLRQMIPRSSYVSIEHLDESTLIYGSMPETRNQVVLDIKVINALMESGGTVSSNFSKPQDYIGKKLKSVYSTDLMEIVGICESGEPAIYSGQNILLDYVTAGFMIASVDELQAAMPDEYDDLELGDKEIMIRESLYAALDVKIGDTYQLGDDSSYLFTVTGTFPDEFEVDYVLSDDGCDYVRDILIYKEKKCMIYTDNADAVYDFFDNTGMNKFSCTLTTPAEDEIEAYMLTHNGDYTANLIIAVVVLLITTVMIYFTIKSNAMSRSEELTVYRLLGISRNSVRKIYMTEMAILTTKTTLPSVLLVSIVVWFIGSVPSLEAGMIFPVWVVIILLVFMYLLHMLISIMPVNNILRQPPAVLAEKE